MHLRSLSSVALLVSSLTLAAHASRAVAQVERAKSTIQFTSASERTTPAEPLAPQQPHDQNLEQARQQPEVAPPSVAAPAEQARPAAHYPVRQAAYAAPGTAPSLMHAPTTGRAPSMASVYSSTNAQSTLNKMPRPTPVQPRPAAPPAHLRGKPFQSVQSEPAISPYLNMYRRDVDSNNLPNYFAFVRPQLEQQEANRQQAAELQKLRGQLQNMSSGNGAPAGSASMTAHAHYMDTAQFYQGMRR